MRGSWRVRGVAREAAGRRRTRERAVRTRTSRVAFLAVTTPQRFVVTALGDGADRDGLGHVRLAAEPGDEVVGVAVVGELQRPRLVVGPGEPGREVLAGAPVADDGPL